jgi:WhiB family redox-sensing transcriptional regulator
MDHAACRGQDVSTFVPGNPLKGDAPPPRLAEVCARCPVAGDCLQYALENPEVQGCWGGTTDAERKALRRRLAA